MKFKLHKILWWTIPIAFLPLVFGAKSAFDLQYHDTYYICASWLVAAVCTIILGLSGGIYWILRTYQLLPSLKVIHVIGTSFAVIGITIISILQNMYRPGNLDLMIKMNSIALILILIFLGVQIIFIGNVLIGLIQGKS